MVRLEGTNVKEGKKLIAESGLTVIAADDLKDGCVKAAKAAAEYRKAKGLAPRPALPAPAAIAYIPKSKAKKSAAKAAKSTPAKAAKKIAKPAKKKAATKAKAKKR